MAVGCVPVVASDVPAYRQYLEDGENAVFVDGDNPESIAGGILTAVGMGEGGRRRYAERNRGIVEREEDWEKNIKRMEMLYEEVRG
jgi:glycosyltransferase involved in cell wall biosynthesis